MNTKKILGIFICMLVMTMIPVAAGATADTSKNPEQSKLGWTFVQGIITQPVFENGGALMSFRCIFVHYSTKGIGQHQSGVLHMGQRLIVPGDFHGIIGNNFIIARFPGTLMW
jgi:hypothetical protein